MSIIALRDLGVAIPGRPGETILATLYRAGYAFRVGCRRGGCGICKVQMEVGSIEYPVTVSEQALSSTERESGITLACRAVPVNDVVISVPAEGKLRCIAPMLTQIATGVVGPGPAAPSGAAAPPRSESDPPAG